MNECIKGNNCPYLNGRNIYTLIKEMDALIRERDALREKIKEQENIMGLAEQKICELKQECTKLQEERDIAIQRVKERLSKVA